MFTIFKKLFGKPEPQPVRVVAAPQQPMEPSVAMPTVEVAHLSLAAIVSHLPEDLKALLRQAPSDTATVALPVPTIMKQLPTGCVKMSLASLHRQAHGLFSPLANGDKRTVDVPLAEVFRHVNPHSLKRRADQRAFRLPENGFNLFGNADNPREIFPTAPADAPPADSTVLDLTQEMPRGLKMRQDLQEQLSGGEKPRASEAPAPPSKPLAAEGVKPQRVVAAPSGFGGNALTPPKPVKASIKEEAAPVVLPLAAIAEAWSEEIRAALAPAIESGANLALPSARLSEGLAKGRVAFTWGQICELITSGPISPGSIDEATSLMIPLRIVAPAFLAAAKQPKTPRKGVYLDASIPAPFSGGHARPPAASAPLPAPELAVPEAAPAPEEPASPEPEPEPSPEPEALAPPFAVEHGKLPETVGEVFGNPQKLDWTPAEIVQNTVRLPGVAGAVVALQEGLQVASSLPDGVKSDVVAAFLPQIFARLNQYAGEMRLGDVDDLLFTTHGAHCQIYRLGYVYFAVLGKPGESLPWHELRLVSEELARQTNK